MKIMISPVLLSCCLDWLLIHHHVLKDHAHSSAPSWLDCSTASTASAISMPQVGDTYRLQFYLESTYYKQHAALRELETL